MSFLSKLFGGGKSRESKTPRDATNSSVSRTGVSVAYHEDVEVAGESYHRRGISSIFLSLGRPEGGVTTQLAELIPEPQNRYDRNAVRVVVNGNQIGHIPQEVSSIFRGLCDRVGRGNVATVPARIWARNDDGTWRARVTLMFSGEVEAEKDYAAERRDAEEQRAAREAARLTKAAEREAKEKLKEARRSAGGCRWTVLAALQARSFRIEAAEAV
ncbi:hypothetical protein G8758_16435 [Arthrobacter woluwensis]|nr:hypothetical protein G8758_16435 [Arthrobacter woluwensis]